MHAVHDPEEEKKKEDDEENRNKEDYDRFKSRYYLITQKKQDDGTVEFNVKHFEFNITCESGENPDPDNCKMKKEQKENKSRYRIGFLARIRQKKLTRQIDL